MRGRISKGLIALVSGAMLGQLILVLATPLLSRIYDAAAFGAFSSLVAVASVLGPIAALKFDVGIIIPRDDEQARGLLRVALLSSVILSVLSGALVWLLSSSAMGHAWALVPGAPIWAGGLVLATAVFTVLSQAALRQRAYGVVAKRAPFQSSGTVAGQIGLGLLGAGSVGLVAGLVIGRLFGFVPLLRTIRPLLKAPKIESYRDLISEFRRLPLALASAALVSALGAQLPLLLVASYFGDADTGEFGMAQRLVAIPASFLGASVAQLFGAELASLVRGGLPGAKQMYLKSSLRLLVAGVAVAVTILFLAPPLIPIVLGAGWDETGALAQAMSVMAAASLVGSPMSEVYTVYQSKATLPIDLVRVLLVGGGWGVALALEVSLVGATWAMAIAQALGYVILWSYGLRLASRSYT